VGRDLSVIDSGDADAARDEIEPRQKRTRVNVMRAARVLYAFPKIYLYNKIGNGWSIHAA
jgi:hypothetical protein